ncbi:MAG: contractile injection system protein, VgrG/Pvc8 family, partial [Pseudomonadota bacterium]
MSGRTAMPRAWRGLPQVRVLVDDATIPRADARALSHIRILRRLCQPTYCELALDTTAAASPTDRLFEPGVSLTILDRADAVLFSGEVTGLRQHFGGSRVRRLCVTAFDPLHRLRKRQSIRAFPELNAVELAEHLVQDMGIHVDCETPGPVWAGLAQWDQSDLAFLDETARRVGLYFSLEGDRLSLVRSDGHDETLDLELGDSLLDADLSASFEPACRDMSVHAWDPWRANGCTVGHAEAEALPESAFDPAVFDANAARADANALLQSTRQAEALARAELDRRIAGERRLHAVAVGNAALRPGVGVRLSNTLGRWSGRYMVASVTHVLDREAGFRSIIDSALPAPPPARTGTVTTLGRVLDADDPDGAGRVRVRLPAYADMETRWLSVLTPGAGPGKGLISVPDRD